MKNLSKKQILIIILMVLCSVSFLYLIITNINSIVDACNHIKDYEHLLTEPGLVADLTKENIISTISQLKVSIVKISFSIVAFSILFSTTMWLLIAKFKELRVVDRINPPTA